FVDEHVAELRVGVERREDPLEHHGLLETLRAVLLGQENLSRTAVGDLAQDRVSRARAHRRDSESLKLPWGRPLMARDSLTTFGEGTVAASYNRVLLVEDDLDVRDTLQDLLESE